MFPSIYRSFFPSTRFLDGIQPADYARWVFFPERIVFLRERMLLSATRLVRPSLRPLLGAFFVLSRRRGWMVNDSADGSPGWSCWGSS